MTTAHPVARRFALVTETYLPQINGVASTLGHLVDGLLARGHGVQLLRPAQPHELPGIRYNSLLCELLVRSLSIPGYMNRQWGLPAGQQLSDLWQNERPDAVYIATEGPLGWSALRVARRLGIPVITGFHRGLQQYSGDYGLGTIQEPAGRYLRWFHNQASMTLTVSASQRQLLKRLGIKRLALLGRGVDSTRFHPAHRDEMLRTQWDAAEGDVVLLYVGHLTAEKNLGLIAESWKQLRHRYRCAQSRIRLVVVGDGPLRKHLEQHLADATFTGALTGHALARVYASADIFVFPSLGETFGSAVTEAMASGLAVNAFDMAAAHQHLTDRYSGCLASVGDQSQFIENLRWLIEDQEGRRGIRLHARHRACQLGWGTVNDRFEGFLLQAAARCERRTA